MVPSRSRKTARFIRSDIVRGDREVENKKARARLKKKIDLCDRMTAPRALAHNKFLVICDDQNKPRWVWTGSQNWSKTGLERPVAPAKELDLPQVQRVRALLRDLRSDPQLAGVARLARDVLAALHVPRALAMPLPAAYAGELVALLLAYPALLGFASRLAGTHREALLGALARDE